MSFASLSSYFWLAGAVVLYRLGPARWRPHALVVFSCALCAASSLTALAMLVGSTIVAYVIGLKLADARTPRSRQLFLYLGIALLVGSLAVFKTAGVLSGVWIPLGLSYYTFKLTSYLVETYWDAAYVQRSALDLAAYSTFGAQLLSGPIQRPASFFEQLTEVRSGKLDDASFEKGVRLILYGLLLKLVIGDRLGSFTAMVSKSPEAYTKDVLFAGAFTYLPQLYADFAGYTNIALGVGLLFGIEGPPNFDRPFVASNLQDYWRRWHMSLTTWLNDYVFTPLRMGTRNWGQVGLVVSIVLNMTLIGVWHGFTWCYLVFGALHGVFLSVSVLTLKKRNKMLGRWKWLRPFRTLWGIVVVQVLLAIGQVFFQAPSLPSALTYLGILGGLRPAGATSFAAIRTDVVDPLLVCWLIAFYVGAGAPGTVRLRELVARWIPNWFRYGVCLLVIAALTLEEGGRFIYGQF